MKITTVGKGNIGGGLARPASVGGLESARPLEDFVTGLFTKFGRPVFYRFASPGEL